MADKIPDPSAKGRIVGKELKSARDALQEEVLTKTMWCVYCLYGGCGTDGLDLPCFFTVGECCCCGGTTKITSCYDQDGCAAFSSKCCCSLVGFEYPPDNTPGIGVGPVRCLGNLDDRKPENCSTMAAANELDTMQKMCCWCWTCYCCYQGCTYDMSPICANEGKLCCLWVSSETADCCGEDGYIEFSGKCCCCVTDCSCPAGNTPGIVCCGATLCCAQMPAAE